MRQSCRSLLFNIFISYFPRFVLFVCFFFKTLCFFCSCFWYMDISVFPIIQYQSQVSFVKYICIDGDYVYRFLPLPETNIEDQ